MGRLVLPLPLPSKGKLASICSLFVGCVSIFRITTRLIVIGTRSGCRIVECLRHRVIRLRILIMYLQLRGGYTCRQLDHSNLLGGPLRFSGNITQVRSVLGSSSSSTPRIYNRPRHLLRLTYNINALVQDRFYQGCLAIRVGPFRGFHYRCGKAVRSTRRCKSVDATFGVLISFLHRVIGYTRGLLM